jgi:DNA polymerase-3 subunit alpha
MSKMPVLDTCTEVTASLLKLPGGRRFKLPTLTELHSFLLIKVWEAHKTADVEATTLFLGIDSKRIILKNWMCLLLFRGIPK